MNGFGDTVRASLSERLGAARAGRYLTSGVRISQSASGVTLEAPDAFSLDMIQRRIGGELEAVVRELAPGSSVSYGVSPTRERAPAGRGAGRSPERPSAPERDRAPRRVEPTRPQGAGLETFVVGESNAIAHGAVLRAVSPEHPGAPVLVHGACGVGKTHLLLGAAQHFRNANRGSKVRTISGEAFTSGFVSAVRTRTVDAFERKFKGLDLLCLDDVHLIAGKEKTQHELLMIFDTLRLGGARVILASDAPPHEIERFHASLASRLSSGIVARIDAPGADMAPALVGSLARRHGIGIDERGVGVLCERIGLGRGATGRDAEGAVRQVQAVASLMDGSGAASASLAHISRAMDLRGTSPDRGSACAPIPAPLAVSVVCEELGVTGEELGGSGRHKRVVLTRELCAHACKTLTTASYPEIARAMGRPNHSSVITAHNRLLKRLEADEVVEIMGTSVPVRALCERLHAAVRARRRG